MKHTVLSLMLLAAFACRPNPGVSYYDDQEMFRLDAGTQSDDPQTPTLPMRVDDWFGPSGYMGDGESGLISSAECNNPSTLLGGRCHTFTWVPGDKGWAGVFWQYPDGNWGTADGLPIPSGATAVVFTAWGERGDEIVTFGAGMGDIDGFSKELSNIALSSTPQEYVIDLTDISYELVVGGFVWTAAQSDGPMTFHLENIRWIEAP